MTRTGLSPPTRRSATAFGSTTSRPSLMARVELRTLRLAQASFCPSPARALTHSGHAFECFHLANTGFCESGQFAVDLCTRNRRKLAPLADGGGSKTQF